VKGIVLAKAAQLEVRAAAKWYSQRQSGLGEEFLSEIGKTFDLIGEKPNRFPFWKSGHPYRKALINRFPYAVFFVEEDERIRVLAAAHLKRKPGYWLAREV
jgi:toxin ParE1/3/4